MLWFFYRAAVIRKENILFRIIRLCVLIILIQYISGSLLANTESSRLKQAITTYRNPKNNNEESIKIINLNLALGRISEKELDMASDKALYHLYCAFCCWAKIELNSTEDEESLKE